MDTTDATNNNAPPIPWDEAVAGAEEALDRLRAALNGMKELSDALATLVVKQLDPSVLDKPATVAAQPN